MNQNVKKFIMPLILGALVVFLFLFFFSNKSVFVAHADTGLTIIAEPNDTESWTRSITFSIENIQDRPVYYQLHKYNTTTNVLVEEKEEQQYNPESQVTIVEDGYFIIYAYTKTGEQRNYPITEYKTAKIDGVKPTILESSVKIDFFNNKDEIPIVFTTTVSDNASGIKTVSLVFTGNNNAKMTLTESPNDASGNKYQCTLLKQDGIDYSSISVEAIDNAGNEHLIPISNLAFLSNSDIFEIIKEVKYELRQYSPEYYSISGQNAVLESINNFEYYIHSNDYQISHLESCLKSIKEAIEGKPKIRFKIEETLSTTNVTINATIKDQISPNIKKGSDIDLILSNVKSNQARVESTSEKAKFLSGISNPVSSSFSITLIVNGEKYNDLQKINFNIDFTHRDNYAVKLFRDNKESNILEEISLSTTLDSAEGVASKAGDFYLVMQANEDNRSSYFSIAGKLYKKSTIGIAIGVVLGVILLTVIVVILINKKSKK